MKKQYLIIAAVCLLIAAFSVFRPINPDEPYYTASSFLVLTGKRPYLDFIFHQMPFIIYVYSLVSHLGILSLFAGRMLSVLFFLAGTPGIWKIMLNLNISKRVSLLFLILYLTNAFLLDWIVAIRLYAISVFLLIWAIVFFQAYMKSFRNSDLFFAGLLFSLLFFTKIIFIANICLLILFITYLFFTDEFKAKARLFIILGSGIIIPVLIFFILFGFSFKTFYFNLVTANFLARDNYLSSFDITLGKFVLYFVIPQNLLLLLIILISGFKKYSFMEKFILLNGVVYFAVHLFAQMLPEYLSVITPLMIVLAASRFQKAKENIENKFVFVGKYNFGIIVLIIYLFFLPLSEIDFRNWVLGNKEIMLRPCEMLSFQNKLGKVPGTSVLSSWEGYSVYSSKNPVMAFNYLGDYVSTYPDKSVLRKYDVMNHEGYFMLIENKKADIVVYDMNNPSHLEGALNYIYTKYNLDYKYKDILVFLKK